MNKKIIQGSTIHLVCDNLKTFLNIELELKKTSKYQEIYKEIIYMKQIKSWWEIKIFTICFEISPE